MEFIYLTMTFAYFGIGGGQGQRSSTRLFNKKRLKNNFNRHRVIYTNYPSVVKFSLILPILYCTWNVLSAILVI